MRPTAHRVVLAGAVLAALLTIASGSVLAQASIRTPADVQSYVSDWRSHALRGEVHPPSLGALARVLVYPDSFAAGTVMAVISAFEEEMERGVSIYMQSAAAHTLATPIRRGHPTYSDIAVTRLVGAYDRTSSVELRGHIVSALFEARNGDADLLRIMEKAAIEPRGSEFTVKLALEILSNNGVEGRSILERLHRSNAVRNPEGRVMMEIIAGDGYRVRRPEP